MRRARRERESCESTVGKTWQAGNANSCFRLTTPIYRVPLLPLSLPLLLPIEIAMFTAIFRFNRPQNSAIIDHSLRIDFIERMRETGERERERRRERGLAREREFDYINKSETRRRRRVRVFQRKLRKRKKEKKNERNIYCIKVYRESVRS